MPSVIIETDFIDRREVEWLKSRNISYNIWKSPDVVWAPGIDGKIRATYPMVAFEIEFTSEQQVDEFRQFQNRDTGASSAAER